MADASESLALRGPGDWDLALSKEQEPSRDGPRTRDSGQLGAGSARLPESAGDLDSTLLEV